MRTIMNMALFVENVLNDFQVMQMIVEYNCWSQRVKKNEKGGQKVSIIAGING